MASTSVIVNDIDNLIKCIAMHFIIHSQKAELDDIKHGLEVLQFGDLIHSHPALIKRLFIESGHTKFSADSFLSQFKIEYSPPGSNKREKEEDVMLHFNYYVEELEGTVCFTSPHSLHYVNCMAKSCWRYIHVYYIIYIYMEPYTSVPISATFLRLGASLFLYVQLL